MKQPSGAQLWQRNIVFELRNYNCAIAADAQIGAGTKIGNVVLNRDATIVGIDCTIGSYVDIEGEVRISDRVSLQSGCYSTRGVVIKDHVFCGPRIVTLSDKKISHRRPTLPC